jgi:hypothetical protein
LRWQRLAAGLALRRPVRLLVFGNRFDPYALAYDLARRTGEYQDILAQRIVLARAETPHQALALLQRTPAAPIPTLAGDLLEPFHDEDLPAAEADDLWSQVLLELRRLSAAAPLVVSAAPSPARPGLFAALARAADAVRRC